MSAGKITIDVSYCNSFKVLRSLLERLSLGGLEFWSAKPVLAPCVRRLVSIWGNCLEKSPFLFIVYVSRGLDPFSWLNSLSNFCVKRIFLTRWNSSRIIYSQILPFTCSILFLSLSYITWLIYICSCNSSLSARCKIVLLCSVLILLF